jgi:Mg-chelatase subunit ChlD
MFLYLFFIINLFITSEQNENKDVYLVLDRSLSMIDKIDSVKEYVKQSVINDILKSGDTLTVITFYGKAENTILRQQVDESNKSSIQQKISGISASGKFTDIGNALDELKNILANEGTSDRQKYILLVTDGKQEAPSTSKYYSPDGKFNHEFMQTIKEVKEMEGWKVMVLGIGKNTITKELANELSGNYTETSENPTKEEIDNVTKNYWLDMELQGEPLIKPIPKNGKTKIIIKVLNKDMNQPKSVTIDNIKLTVGVQTQERLIDKNFIFIVEPNKTAIAEIPVQINMDLKPGVNIGEISFRFPNDIGFSPSSKKINFKVQGFIGNNIWVIPVGILLLLALIAFIVFIIYTISSTVYFKILATDVSLNKYSFRLKPGKHLFINDSKFGFDITPSRNKTAIARILAHKHGVSLYALDPKRIQNANNIPANVLNISINIMKQDGNYASLKFVK